MKHYVSIVVLGFALCYPALPSLAQDAEPAAQEPDREPDREQLRALKAVAEKAMSGEDMIHTLREHVTDDFTIVTFTSRQFDDFDVFVEEWNKSRKKFLDGGSFAVTMEPKPTVFEGDIAICHGDSTNVMVTGDGTRYEFQSPWTAVCRKEDGAWKIVRAHSSIDPFGNPVLNANVRRYFWMIGLGGAVGGAAIATLACAMRRRRA